MTVRYRCSECDKSFQWYYKICPNCREIDTLIKEETGRPEKKKVDKADKGTKLVSKVSMPKPLSKIKASSNERWATPMSELNRVLGGGIVPGSVILLGGKPGQGKSTLLLQVATAMANEKRILYISNEESEGQIKMRAERLELDSDNLFIAYHDTPTLENFEEAVSQIKPDIVILDSINELYDSALSNTPGSVTQIRNAANKLRQFAKATSIPIFIIAQVTKAGEIAGPEALMHIVDTVLYLEGDAYHLFRLLRAEKNRFGDESEVGVMTMTGKGLEEVLNPSEYLLSERVSDRSGTVVTATLEGARVLLPEVQALCTVNTGGSPQRDASGIDRKRLIMMSAVIDKHVDAVSMEDVNVIANSSGGFRLYEPSTDLAIVISVISSYINEPVGNDILVVGEIDLTGIIRSVPQIEQRLKEAKKLGFKSVITSRLKKNIVKPKGLRVIEAVDINDAVVAIFGKSVRDILESKYK